MGGKGTAGTGGSGAVLIRISSSRFGLIDAPGARWGVAGLPLPSLRDHDR